MPDRVWLFKEALCRGINRHCLSISKYSNLPAEADESTKTPGRCDRNRPGASLWQFEFGKLLLFSYVPPRFQISKKVEWNFRKLNIGQNQQSSGYFQHFSVCSIITHFSTRLTMPVTFISILPSMFIWRMMVLKNAAVSRETVAFFYSSRPAMNSRMSTTVLSRRDCSAAKTRWWLLTLVRMSETEKPS